MKFYEFYVKTFQWKAVLQRKQMRKVFVPIDNEEWVKEEDYPVKMDLLDAYHDKKYGKAIHLLWMLLNGHQILQ